MNKILKFTAFAFTVMLVSPGGCFAGRAIYKSVGRQMLYGNNAVTKQ